MTFGKTLILYIFSAFHLNPFAITHSFENDSYIDISTYIP